MSKREHFTFGGVNSLAFNIWIQKPHTENMAERDVELITIPGRTGSLIVDHKCWKNVKLKYELIIAGKFTDQFRALKSMMLSKRGYQRLENSFEPDVYRMATVHEMVEAETTPYHKDGVFSVIFDSKPQRYLKSGEQPVVFSKAGRIHNRYGYPAQPLLHLQYSGAGELHIGDYTVKLYDTAAGELTIDCEAMDAYRGAENMNRLIGCDSFPVLEAGDNKISWTGGILQVTITPRWWVL